jgi:hypothetical protein
MLPLSLKERIACATINKHVICSVTSRLSSECLGIILWLDPKLVVSIECAGQGSCAAYLGDKG